MLKNERKMYKTYSLSGIIPIREIVFKL